ncbi:hypothetical protein [Salinarimonas sp.]|uniref:hypothetical protein n=1 Tax=Salinarimonas sp. TaxID=2766526 RepID=UPI0032D8D22F
MTRTTFLLATLLILALSLAPRAGLAQQERGADAATGSVADTRDQPTRDQIRRLLRERDGADGGDLPPPSAISPEIDLLAPAPDEFQEP